MRQFLVSRTKGKLLCHFDLRGGKMKFLEAHCFALLFLPALFMGNSYGHSINYQVLEKGLAVRAFYSEKDPFRYSQYEIGGAGDREDLPLPSLQNANLALLIKDPHLQKVKRAGSTKGFRGARKISDHWNSFLLSLKSFVARDQPLDSRRGDSKSRSV